MKRTPKATALRRLPLLLGLLAMTARAETASANLELNELEYLEMPGLNVMLAHDYYPEGHQGGVSIIQNGLRVATNGDLRLERAPGQWSPVPKMIGERATDAETETVSARFKYPDEKRNRAGFNPIDYPDLDFSYRISIQPEDGASFLVTVDLDEPLPPEWDGKVSFMLELFPGFLFGKSFQAGPQFGIFPRQPNGPGEIDSTGAYQIAPLATAREIVIAPEDDKQRMAIASVAGSELELLDGRGEHSNGWFIVRATLAKGASERALVWRVTPSAIPGWLSEPVIQVSQVGYRPEQPKLAVVELDKNDAARHPIRLSRVKPDGSLETALESSDAEWGRFLRFQYLRLDFTQVTEPGMYVVSYGDKRSNPFQIGRDAFSRHVWQPTLDYFLPVQMCHVRVNDRYHVWHGACHLDDARMAPVDHNHFDGYLQGPETMTDYQPGEPVPGLNRGGWHDAGDDDLRVESQAGTVFGLALAYEEFGADYDNTTIDQERLVVELHRPDGKPDMLQQIEHGVLTVLGGYKSLGRLYRGIITPTLRQYVMLGDTVNNTDNQVFDPATAPEDPPAIGLGIPGGPDDRWVFTENSTLHESIGAAGLAAASRVLRGYDDALAEECLAAAKDLWTRIKANPPGMKLGLAVELLVTTGDAEYADYIVQHSERAEAFFGRVGWQLARAYPLIDDAGFRARIRAACEAYAKEIAALQKKTPYGVPYEPDIWGAGWEIQRFGAQQYFLNKAFPDLFTKDAMLNALSFILGCHPGSNQASFVSGVGSESVLVAYGLNRADWSFIPGGSASGTALIRPDYPELLAWPFLWQQTEYVLGGGTTDYLFLAQAADHLMDEAR